jgi:hypothetical protein
MKCKSKITPVISGAIVIVTKVFKKTSEDITGKQSQDSLHHTAMLGT